VFVDVEIITGIFWVIGEVDVDTITGRFGAMVEVDIISGFCIGDVLTVDISGLYIYKELL